MKKERFYNKLGRLFFHPKKFFDEVEKEKSYSGIIFFYVKVSLVLIVVQLLTNVATLLITSGSELVIGIFNSIISSLINLGLAFFVPFIYAVVIHLGVLIFKGKKGFFNTYKPIAYTLSIQSIYSLIALVIVWPIAMINASSISSLPIEESLWQNSGFVTVMVLYGLITLISIINLFYTGTIGISKLQKISKLRAFLAIIVMCIIVLIAVALLVGLLSNWTMLQYLK